MTGEKPQIPGQMGFSDEEMGIKPSGEKKAPNQSDSSDTNIPEDKQTETEPVQPEKREKITDTRLALLSVEVGTILDPNPPRGQKPREITIHDYLLREVDNSWFKCQRKSEIAKIITERFDNNPELIRLLAQAYRTDYIQQLERDLRILEDELAKSIDANDRIYNPRALAEQDNLRRAIEESRRTLQHKKDVANDIAYGLEKIADLLEKNKSNT